MKNFVLSVSALVAAICLNAVHADATLHFDVTTNKQTTPQVQTVYVKGGRFMVQAAGGDRNIDLLYDRAKDTMYVIDHQGKSYMTFDEKTVLQLGQAAAMVTALRRQLAEQLQKMPPEQQERMRKMLGDIDPPAAAEQAPRSVKKLGMTSVNGYACERLAVYRGAKKFSEMCVSQARTVGLSEDDYKTIKALQAFQERVWTQASKITDQAGGHMPEFGGKNINGVPIEMKDFAGPAPTTMVVSKAYRGVGGKALGIPQGYKATSLPSFGGPIQGLPAAQPK